MFDQSTAKVLEEAAHLGLLPGEDEPVRRALYEATLSTSDLPIADYQLVRDLLCLTGLETDAALEAGVLALLIARQEGSLCLSLEAETVEQRLPQFPEAAEVARQFITSLNDGLYDGPLIGREESEFRPLIVSGKYFYFQGSYADERALHRGYQQRLQRRNLLKNQELKHLRESVQEVLHASPRLASGERLQLNKQQQWALGLALLQNFVVVTGGPGTGKTAIVLALLRYLVRAGVRTDRIALAAPTGRAAHRINESLRAGLSTLNEPTAQDQLVASLEGQTLHRLLGYSPARNSFTFDLENPLDLDVLIVDEVSMIDATLMARLLEAVPASTRLVLLGDVHQIPSVEAGAVLADLVPPGTTPTYSAAMVDKLRAILPEPPEMNETARGKNSMSDRVVLLVEDFRSVPQIQELARVVNRFDGDSEADLLDRLIPGDSVCRLDEKAVSGPAYWKMLSDWAEQHYLDDEYVEVVKQCQVPAQVSAELTPELALVMSQMTHARILTAVHEGARGCVGINKFLANFLGPIFDPTGHERYFLGTPLMVTRNDYALELFNGDTGVILNDSEGGQRVAFPRGDQVLLIPVSNLPDHVMAFAITVHKSQGSEFDHVLLVLPSERDSSRAQRLLSRQILYTAITRSRESVTINAQRNVFLQACRNVLVRESGLNL